MPLFINLPPPAIISDESAALVGAITNTLAANTVYLYAFELQSPTVILGGKWHMGATVTGTANMGIYTLAGNLVAGSDSGAITNVVSSDVSFTYGTPIVLSAGQYLMALAPSNSTDTYLSRSTASTMASTRARKATNVMASNALPSTTGAFVTTTANYPGCSLTVQGGL